MRIKRVLSTMLLFLFAFSILPAGRVVATTVGSITMTSADGSEKSNSLYHAYKIVNFDVSTDASGKIVYTNPKINTNYREVIAEAMGLSSTKTDYEILSAITDDLHKMAELAIMLKNTVGSASYSTSDQGKFNNLDPGYYLILETANLAEDGDVISRPILVGFPDVDQGYDVKIKVKTSRADIEKKIVVNGDLYDTNTAAVDEVVNYWALAGIPRYSSDAQNIKYYVTDTLSSGLSFNGENSVIAKIVKNKGELPEEVIATLNRDHDYILKISDINGATFRLELKNSNAIKEWGEAGYNLLITYSATLLNSASYGATGNPNSINLTYSVKPSNGDDATIKTTRDDTVITYTNKLKITKIDKENNKLKGATFKLSKENDATWVKVLETSDQGELTFDNLEQGVYILEETNAPTGYNLMDHAIKFTISAANKNINVTDELTIPNKGINVTESGNSNAANNFKAIWKCVSTNNEIKVNDNDGTLSITIVNTKGFTLPGTGGSGTTIFTVVGISIILLGCSIILIYMKKTRHPSNAK